MERFLGHNSRSILPHAHCSSIMHYVWSIMQCNTQLCLIDVLFCIMIVQLCLLTRPLCILYLQLFNMPIIFCNASFLMALWLFYYAMIHAWCHYDCFIMKCYMSLYNVGIPLWMGNYARPIILRGGAAIAILSHGNTIFISTWSVIRSSTKRLKMSSWLWVIHHTCTVTESDILK